MALTSGGSRIDLTFKSIPNMQAASIPNERSVQILNGNIYKTGNTDLGEGLLLASGNYANPVGTNAIGDWIEKSNDFTLITNQRYEVDGTNNTVDIELPETLNIDDEIVVHVRSTTGFKIQMINPNFTIQGPLGVINPGTDMQIEAGETPRLLAISATVLEVV